MFRPQKPYEEEDETDRRRFLQGVGGLTGALMTATYAESVELDRHLEASDVGPATPEQLDRTVERLGREYLSRPLPELVPEIRGWRQYVVGLLNGKHTLAQQQHLYQAAGWLSDLLGIAAFALGHNSTAEGHLATALHLAREVDHNNLAARVHVLQATMATYADQPQQAVAYAQAGQELAPVGSAAESSLLAQEAKAHARMGDLHNFERAMGLATESFDQMTEQPTSSIFSVTAPDFSYYAGTSYLWLQQPRRAREQAQEAIGLCDAAPAGYPVARVVARIDLATALVQLGELDEACAVGTEALGIHMLDPRPGPIISRAAELHLALEPHRTLPPARDFDERLHAVSAYER